jgi:tetratricopeptide (TPR) repeat protein
LAQLTAEIAASPHSAELYLQRGRVHGLHQHWSEALADLERATELAPGLEGLDLVRGELFAAMGRSEVAHRYLTRHLEADPDSLKAHRLDAEVLRRLDRPAAAAGQLARAVELQSEPSPHLILLYTDALAADGQVPTALSVLDQASARLGYLASFASAPVELELSLGRREAALERLRGVAKQSPRAAVWHAWRGRILADLGRPAEALEAFDTALDSLAEDRRGHRAGQQLAEQIRGERAQLRRSQPTHSSLP